MIFPELTAFQISAFPTNHQCWSANHALWMIVTFLQTATPEVTSKSGQIKRIRCCS